MNNAVIVPYEEPFLAVIKEDFSLKTETLPLYRLNRFREFSRQYDI